MKRLFASLCVLVLALICVFALPVTAQAEEYTAGDYTYTVENGEATITKYNGYGGTVSIPASLGGNDVTAIGFGAFAYCDDLLSVTIPDSVTAIAPYAFYDCTNLPAVTIPDSVAAIGEYAFASCENLSGIWVDANNAVYSSDDSGVLFDKEKRALLAAPGCISGTYTIPDTVLSIGKGAFSFCKSLTGVMIPGRVISIESPAFSSCTSLTGIWVNGNNPIYSSDDSGVLFDKKKSVLIAAPGGILGTYSIPSTVTTVEKNAFYHCVNLKSVCIPDSVTTISTCAFAKWFDFASVTIPGGMVSIDWSDLYLGERLTDVYYSGTEEQWKRIFIDANNDGLVAADIWYNHVTGHVFRNYKSDENATCTKDGTETAKCDYCDKTDTRTGKGSAKGHSYAAATCTKAKTCVRCKLTSGKALGHSYTNACDSTCNRAGCKTTRSTSHNYKTTLTRATTTKDGSIIKKCTVCGKVASNITISCAKVIKLSATSYTYDGKAKTPTVTVKDSAGATLKKNVDYTVTYASGRKNAGTYKVTVKLMGNYTGTKTLTFKINPAKATSKFTFKLSDTKYTYSGKAKTPIVTVKDASGKTLKKNTDYTVSYAKGRKNVGTYKVTIKMKGNYTGTKTLSFKIVPKAASINKLTAKSKAIAVKLNRVTAQSTGYEIQYSTKKNFSGAKTKVVKSYKTSSETLSGLKAKKTYYVRVRTYKTVKGEKIYSGWSAVKYIKTK